MARETSNAQEPAPEVAASERQDRVGDAAPIVGDQLIRAVDALLLLTELYLNQEKEWARLATVLQEQGAGLARAIETVEAAGRRLTHADETIKIGNDRLSEHVRSFAALVHLLGQEIQTLRGYTQPDGAGQALMQATERAEQAERRIEAIEEQRSRLEAQLDQIAQLTTKVRDPSPTDNALA